MPPKKDDKKKLLGRLIGTTKKQKLLRTVGGVVGLIGGGLLLRDYLANRRNATGPIERPKWSRYPLPCRSDQMSSLRNDEFDMLVIGGGATGCGVALDAVARGLKVALVEKYDFASGTSSRSTKLIHGGVRYLQSAIMNLNYEQYQLVQEALSERANLLAIAPHLSFPLPIMLPVYEWWQVPYFWAGIKMYDQVSGAKKLKSSYLLSKKSALEKFPMLKEDKLKAAIVYYDGSHNDARMNLSIAITAARRGATIANYCEVKKLIITPPKLEDMACESDMIRGAEVYDSQTGTTFKIKAKCVVNATGPFTDSIRQMDDKDKEKICQPSAGVHVILPGYYSPDAMGLLDPSTSDGRVIFFLPWQGLTIAGTTDSPSEITHNPAPCERDIQFILSEIRSYLTSEVQVRRGDVQSSWSGIRPLVTNPNSTDTKSLSRSHVVEVSKNNLITIAGGKWTTYRTMAEDCVNAAIETCKLQPSKQGCQTLGLRLEGGHQWTPNHFIKLAQTYGLDAEVAKHLSETYGDRAGDVAKLASVTGKRHPTVGKRLAEDFPYIEAEVRYAVREYAVSAADVLSLRTRLAFLSYQAAEEALPRVLEIMAEELSWSPARVEVERKKALQMIEVDMGKACMKNLKGKRSCIIPKEGGCNSCNTSKKISPSSIILDAQEVRLYAEKFRSMDKCNKGFITRLDIDDLMEEMNVNIEEKKLECMINEIDLNNNGKVELDEFLMLMSDLKHGHIKSNALTTILKSNSCIPCDKSGGGV